MCVDPATLAIISSVASVGKTGLDFFNNRSANKRQDREATDAIRRQNAFNKRATDAVNDTLPDLQASKRGEVLQQIENDTVDSSVQALDTQRAITGGLPQNVVGGRVSNDFLESRAAETISTTKRGAELARLLGRVEAPVQASQNESFGRARLATDLGQIQNFGAGQAGADELSIQSAGQLNPLASLASGFLGGVDTFATAKRVADSENPKKPKPPPGVKTTGLGIRQPLILKPLPAPRLR